MTDVSSSDLEQIWRLTPGSAFPVGLHDAFDGAAVGAAFDVARAAEASTFAAHHAMAHFGELRGLAPALGPLNRRLALDSFSGHLEIDGAGVPKWADLSGAYRTGDDRWIQLHCNFDHHAVGAASVLGVQLRGDQLDRPAFEAAIQDREAVELESELIDRGMIGAAYRTLGEWSEHPHAAATADLPLLSYEQIGDADPLPLPSEPGRSLDGVNVLDCSRVLAGPVAGQTLAAAGANVLRIGGEHLPSVRVGVVGTGFGKRNCFVDLRTAEGVSGLRTLAQQGHVLIDAYRPGALASHGFSEDRLATIRPGIVVIQLCAFDWIGPWAGRRGFDSIVQSTTGLAMAGSWAAEDTDDRPPRHLPVQALDYATGFLAAHAAARLLAHQQQVGGSWLVRLSLLRTRNWLAAMGGPFPFTPSKTEVGPDHLLTMSSEFGEVTVVKPMTGSWDVPPAPLGSSPAEW